MKKNPNKTVVEQSLKIFYNDDRTAARIVFKEQGLNDLQLYGNKLNGVSYQRVTEIEFNTLQQRMYKRLVYGIENIPKAEMLTIDRKERERIIARHARAQEVINIYKNEVMAITCDKIFGKIFWNSPIAKEMVAYSSDSEALKEENTLSFRELGIKKHQLAAKFIESGLLPLNFFQLSA
jgi:hypothetical protein